ncbi:hypothetical protein M405DRAFT_528087 [Rhizopogon salebrosus TDB-379]|nr:hypothetical protein M405DRAFT_528087 [Rhizopogon salebrosus TDB-379]
MALSPAVSSFDFVKHAKILGRRCSALRCTLLLMPFRRVLSMTISCEQKHRVHCIELLSGMTHVYYREDMSKAWVVE